MTAKIPSFFTDSSAHAAAHEYIARRDRKTHPAGEFDRAGRWYPNADERCDCCRSIRSPSRAWPLSYMKHCRSVEHVAALYDVDASDLRKLTNRIEQVRAGDVGTMSRARLIVLLEAIAAHAPDAGLRDAAMHMRAPLVEAALNRIARTDRVSRETEIAAAGEVVL